MMYGKFVIRYEDVASIRKENKCLLVQARQGEEVR